MPGGSNCDPPSTEPLGFWDQAKTHMGPIQWPGSNPHTCFYPLQVLHKVMVVTGLQCVPEEHDVRCEVQTLQVMGEGGSRYLSFITALLLHSWPPVTSEWKDFP